MPSLGAVASQGGLGLVQCFYEIFESIVPSDSTLSVVNDESPFSPAMRARSLEC